MSARTQFRQVVGAKQRNANAEKKEAGRRHLALGCDRRHTKLVPHWRVGARSLKDCYWFVHLAERIEGRLQLTTDAFRPYAQVVEAVLGKRSIMGSS